MVVFCKAGTRSTRALELLVSTRFIQVENLKGGIEMLGQRKWIRVCRFIRQRFTKQTSEVLRDFRSLCYNQVYNMPQVLPIAYSAETLHSLNNLPLN